jgi:hypothetical protein
MGSSKPGFMFTGNSQMFHWAETGEIGTPLAFFLLPSTTGRTNVRNGFRARILTIDASVDCFGVGPTSFVYRF